MDGYRALRESAGWLDLSSRGRIRVTGEDRVRLLHALVSNHVQQLQPGQGCYAFFLNAQGRILADVNLLCLADALLLDVEPEAREGVWAHVDKYIIADDVTLEDITDQTAELGLEGPRSSEVLSALGAPIPEAAYAHETWGDAQVVRVSSTGLPGFSLLVPAPEKAPWSARLESAGAAAATPEEARVVRIEVGRPRYGEDLSDRYLPHETQTLHGVHFTKGCYLGQEIVERVRSRGGVHRFLVRLEIDAPQAPEAGAPVVTAEGREVGVITSAALSPALGKVVALGYVRLDEIGAGPQLVVGGAAARIAARRPAE